MSAALAWCSTDTAAEDVLAVIAERAPAGKLILAGHSLGGQIAFAALRRAPEDVRHRIAGLVLVSTAIDRFAANGVPELLNLRVVGWLAGLLKASEEGAKAARQNRWSGRSCARDRGILRPTNRRVTDLHAYDQRNTAGYLPGLPRRPADHDESAVVPHLSGVPGLFSSGTTTTSHRANRPERLPCVAVRAGRVTHAGHMLPLEAPKEVTRHVRWQSGSREVRRSATALRYRWQPTPTPGENA